MILSVDKDIQLNVFEIKYADTYFSSVISHAYYCIFYSAKAYLLKKGIRTSAPEEHRKTYEEFRRLVNKGIIDVELLKLYKKVMVKAEALLGIFQIEKSKRGRFTYHILSQANLEPARESLNHAKKFFSNVYGVCRDIT